METYFEVKLWFLVGFVGIGVLALIGIGIAGLVRKVKRRARDRRKEREAAWAAHSKETIKGELLKGVKNEANR